MGWTKVSVLRFFWFFSFFISSLWLSRVPEQKKKVKKHMRQPFVWCRRVIQPTERQSPKVGLHSERISVNEKAAPRKVTITGDREVPSVYTISSQNEVFLMADVSTLAYISPDLSRSTLFCFSFNVFMT